VELAFVTALGGPAFKFGARSRQSWRIPRRDCRALDQTAKILSIPGRDGGIVCGGLNSAQVPSVIENPGKRLTSPWFDSSSFSQVDHKTMIVPRCLIRLRISAQAGDPQR
jgi:hypothetical protein